MDNPHNIPLAQDESDVNIARTLGRIETAIVNMAGDIHEAVAAQKAIVERLEKGEQRLGSLEEWRRNAKQRNETWGKIALVLIVPFVAWGIQAGTYLVSLTHKLELHEKLFPKYYKP